MRVVHARRKISFASRANLMLPCALRFRERSFAGLGTPSWRWFILKRATRGKYVEGRYTFGRARALNPLFIAAISLGKYSEARGHIDVACVRGGGALIITYHARKARYASYARDQKHPSRTLPFPTPLHRHRTHITAIRSDTPALLRRRRCLSLLRYRMFMLAHLHRDP